MVVNVYRARRNLHPCRRILAQNRAMHSIFESRRGLYICELDRGEPLEKYGPGGFHPVSLGDTFDGERYRIIHKLGYGGFSTVWLARDQKSFCNIALKISVAHTTAENQRESAVVRTLKACHQDLPGKRFIFNELDSFQHRGPNGLHQVSVMELLGSSTEQAARECFRDKRFPSSIAREVSKQAAQGISYLHMLDIAHGGTVFCLKQLPDIHPGNLVFAVPKLQTMTESSVIKTIGQPETFRVCRSDLGPHEEGVPAYLVGPIRNPIIPDLSRDFEIRLVDFGNSFLTDNPPRSLSTPMHVRAPEVALGAHFDNRADLWSLGCTIFTLFAGGAAFDGFSNRHLIVDMIDKLGQLPLHLRDLHTPLPDMESDFSDLDDDGDDYDFQQWLEVLMFDEEKSTDLTRQHVQKLGCLIMKLLQYQPAQRITAADLVCDPLWEEILPSRTWQSTLLQRMKLRQWTTP